MTHNELTNAIASLVADAVRIGVDVERERCAKIAEEAFIYRDDDPLDCGDASAAGNTIAQLIRDNT